VFFCLHQRLLEKQADKDPEKQRLRQEEQASEAKDFASVFGVDQIGSVHGLRSSIPALRDGF
jgi:hypothetical protein